MVTATGRFLFQQRRSRRAVVLAGLRLAGVAALVSCSQQSAVGDPRIGAAPATQASPTLPGGAAQPGSTPAASATIQSDPIFEMVLYSPQGDLSNHVVEYAKRWTAANPKRPLRVDALPATNEYWVKLAALDAAKTIGDVVVEVSRMLPEMASKGLYRDLLQYIQGEKLDMAQYYPVAVAAGKVDGKQYALPETYELGPVLLYYNQDLFDAAGIPYPDTVAATYEEVVDKAIKLTKPGGAQFGYAGATGAHFVHIRSFGGNVLDESRSKTRLGDQQAVSATEWIQELIHRQKAHPSPDQLQRGTDAQLFADGKIAMLQQNLATGASLTKLVGNRFKYGAALVPNGPTGVMGTLAQASLVTVTAGSRVPDDAWQVAKFMTTKEIGLEKVALNAGGPGARPDVQGDLALQDKLIGLKTFQAALQENRFAYPEPKPANARCQEFYDAVELAARPIWLNQANPVDGMKKVAVEAQKILDKPRA